VKSNSLQIIDAFKKHFDRVAFIRLGEYNRLALSSGDCHLEIDISSELIDIMYPYDIVNDIWGIIYENFSEWSRV
jgi:hypothetical protein